MSTESQRVHAEPGVHTALPKYIKAEFMHATSDQGVPRMRSSLHQDGKPELVLKIRVADAADPDFIEIELPQNELTYRALTRICCQELNLDPSQIVKLRKLPNTKLRKDEDVQRLQNFQEIEVVTSAQNAYKFPQNQNGAASPVSNNGYTSFSKKDQTILY